MERCRENTCAGIDDPTNICNRVCEEGCPSQCVNDDEDYSIKEEWLEKMNKLCMAIGDCGSSVNYIGDEGYYDDPEDFVSRSGEEDED